MMRQPAVAFVFLLPFSTFVGAGAKSAIAQEDTPSILQSIGVDQKLGNELPLHLPFRDSRGETTTLGTLFPPRPVLLVPVYYRCPMLCGETLHGLAGALKALPFAVGRELDVVVVSFDPNETPEQAASKRDEILEIYGERGAPAGWHFLTGSDESVRALNEAIGFRYARDTKRDLYAHAAVVVLATPEGRVSRYFFGIDYAPRDLRLGLLEASKGSIGSIVDELLLYCYHYDPSTGRYGVVILNVLRIAGVATTLLLGGFMILSFRHDWRSRGKAEV